MTGLGQMHLVTLAINPVIARRLFFVGVGLALHLLEHRRHLVDLLVQLGVIVGLPGDDQRRAGFVDKNGIDLINHCEVQPALAAIARRVLHVVAQVVEAVFVVGTVGDVGRIGRLLGVGGLLRQHRANRQTQKLIEPPHPGRIA